MRDHVNERRDGQMAMSGGSSETEVNAFTTRPSGPLASAALTNVTPVAKRPRAARNAAVPNGAGADPPTSGTSTSAGSARLGVSRIRPKALTGPPSVELGRLAEGDVGEIVVGAVGAEWVHERAGLDVAVGARERAPIDVARAA